MSTLYSKHDIRKKFQEIRKNISTEKKQHYSHIICTKLTNIIRSYQKEHKKKCITICLFAGTKNEPDVTNLLNIFSDDIYNKTIQFYFPKCEPRKDAPNIMNFYKVNTLSDLGYHYHNTPFRIREPKPQCEYLDIHTTLVDFFIIPAVSIDKKNNRIGMGAGFYDRYLQKYFAIHKKNNTTLICTVFSQQISQKSFTHYKEKFDIPTDRVVTEQ